jgi:hypothetical protein
MNYRYLDILKKKQYFIFILPVIFYWWRNKQHQKKTTNLLQVNGKFYDKVVLKTRGARCQITSKEEPDVRSHRRRSQMSDHIEGEARCQITLKEKPDVRSHRRRSQMSDHIEGEARCQITLSDIWLLLRCDLTSGFSFNVI